MAKKFAELRAKMSPEARARVDERVQAALQEMPLNELRRARDLAQKTVGDILGMAQPEVSKLEQRSDALISTIRHYIEAMGGELDIIARFRDGDVRITQFGNLDGDRPEAPPSRRRRNQRLDAAG